MIDGLTESGGGALLSSKTDLCMDVVRRFVVILGEVADGKYVNET